MRKALATGALVLAIAGGLVSPTLAQQSQNSTTEVTVNPDLSVDVAPDTLTYTIDPGDYNASSQRGYTGIEVENTGSKNISDVWANASMPTDRPFGTGIADEYDAGNFIQLNASSETPGTSDDVTNGFHYVNRREFAEPNNLEYVLTDGLTPPVDVGRFRTGNESYFWAITDSTSCIGGGTSNFVIGDVSKTSEREGTIDLSGDNSGSYSSVTIESSDSATYGQANVTVNTFDGQKNYTAYTQCDGQSGVSTTNVVFNKWNVYSPNRSEGIMTDVTRTGFEADRPIIDATDDAQELKPGQHFSLQTRVSVPRGVAQGSVTDGQLSIVVSDDDTGGGAAGVGT
jgi:hypothetical protein